MLSKSDSKQKIIENFHKNILGKYPDKIEINNSHKGKLGHWIESKLGGRVDSDGNADLDGFECKIESKKISWGDWGASYRIFCDKSYKLFNKRNNFENMWMLVKALGVKRNSQDNGDYYSLSGKDVPKYINDETNTGLSLREVNGDIIYNYNFSTDQRNFKSEIVPDDMQKDDLVIFKWHGTNKSFKLYKENLISNNLPISVLWNGPNASVSLEERIRRKFGIYGVVVVLMNDSKKFCGLKFLKNISFYDWLNFFKNREVIYDSALTTRNRRPYNQWRSTLKFMKKLEDEIYIP